MVRSWTLLAVCGLLAVPTALDPSGALAGISYLSGLALVVLALWWGAVRSGPDGRRAWLALAGTGSCWLTGDVVQRIMTVMVGPQNGVGPQDLFWLASYPLLIVAVAAMLGARGLKTDLRRELRLDVLVVAGAASVAAWHLMIAPAIAAGGSIPTILAGALYPLGDVVAFGLATTLVLAPGRRGVPTAMIIACLALTLPVDFLQTVLPDQDSARLDAVMLIVNSLLGAVALHPGRAELTARANISPTHGMHRWRIVLLGVSLCSVSIVTALPNQGLSNVLAGLVAATVVSVVVVVRFFRLVRDRELAETALIFQAHHDQLTGVANRLLLMARLSSMVRRGSASLLAIVFIDLDGFKNINDTWGHPAGDEVLRTVARRLSGLVRPTDTVARVGGDEFVLLCDGVSEKHAELLGHRIREAISQPIELGSASATVGASVGVLTAVVATMIAGGDSSIAADELLRRADSAMYEAKRDGGGVRLILTGAAA